MKSQEYSVPSEPSENMRVGGVDRGARFDFGIDAWGYNHESVQKMMHRVSRGDAAAQADLEKALQEGGGKALGLKICELVSKNFAATSYTLTVPPWVIVPSAENLNPHDHAKKILRSSSKQEDWLSAEAGTLQSYNFRSAFDVGNFLDAKNKRYNQQLFEGPFVLQEAKQGYGLVVDIVESALAGKTIVKIASGNLRRSADIGREEFSSATNDFESAVGIWEARNGSPIVPTRNFGYPALFEDNKYAEHPFVQPLFDAVKKTGISFGVQLEMVVHPDEPSAVHLVQIRPSPEMLRRQIIIASTPIEKKHVRQELFTRSAIVNGRFDASGQAYCVGEQLSAYYASGDNLRHDDLDQRAEHRGVSGHIGIIDRDRGPREPSSLLTYGKAPAVHLGAYFYGHDIQITPKAIRPNSHHGSLEHAPGSEKIYDFLDNHCGMLSLSEEEIKRLAATIEGGGERIRVVSDGLMAEIYVLKV